MTIRLTGLLLLAVGLMLGAGKTAQNVKAAEKAWAEASVKADRGELEKVLADDLQYTHSTGDDDTKQMFIENMSNGVRKYTKIEHETIAEPKIMGNIAILRAVARIETIQKGKPGNAHLKWIHVFRYHKGRWQLLEHQSLRLPN